MPLALPVDLSDAAIFPIYPVIPDLEGKAVCGCGRVGCDRAGKHPACAWGDLIEGEQREPSEGWHPWNVGLCTGVRSGCFVLDLDTNGEVNGLDNFAAICRGNEFPETLTATTQRGGVHIYLKAPDVSAIRNSAGKLAPGVDVRGEGGYVVIPPSKGVVGIYAWDQGPEQRIALAPAWLLDLLGGKDGGANGPIAAGQRNATLFKLGASLRGKGADESTLLKALREANALRCIPPLTDLEVRRIVASVAKYPALPEGTINDTELANAHRLARDHGGLLRHCPSFGWRAWDGKRWGGEDMAKAQVHRAAAEVARALAIEAEDMLTSVEHLDDGPEKTAGKALARAFKTFARRSQAHSALCAMVGIAENLEPIAVSADAFDRDRGDRGDVLFNCLNGTLVLGKDGKVTLREHHKEDMLTLVAGVEYQQDAACDGWLRFLDRIFGGDRELIRYVQKACGYTMAGEATEQCFFLLWGSGANGKSTFLEVLAAVFGDYAQSTMAKTLMSPKDEGVNNDLAGMRGARFVRCSETSRDVTLNEARIKKLTGGDVVRARFLFREYFEYRPQFVLWLTTNAKPEIVGTDHAIWRRVRLVPFTVTIPENEQDPRMVEHLLAERSGVLGWLIEGYRMWRAEGLHTVEVVKDATAEYRAEQDDFGGFLSDACRVGDGLSCMGKALNMAYDTWAFRQSARKLSGKQLAQRLRDAGFNKRHTDKGEVWVGICPVDQGVALKVVG